MPLVYLCAVETRANLKDWRVEILVQDDREEACYVYDLLRSGRLIPDTPDTLPVPWRGQFLFKLPQQARPIPIQVARMDTGAEERMAGRAELRFYVAPQRGPDALIAELQAALRDVPPTSEEEFKSGASTDEHARVRAMTHAQRIIYATKAGASGRSVLLQQPNPLLLLYLCKNPLITLPEIIAVAKLPSIDALVADYLARMLRSNPQWGANEELRMALATNVKTPGGTALSLLKTLNSRNLRQICKQGDTRGPIKQAALRILLERRD